MLTLTYAPDGATSWTGASAIVLCNTSRSLTELDVKFNHKRLIQTEPGFGAAAAAFFDNANAQNTLSLKVRRGVDFTGATFPDPEGALAFALQQPASFPTTGALRVQLQGVTTNTTLYLLNCSVAAIVLADWLGSAPAFEYTFAAWLGGAGTFSWQIAPDNQGNFIPPSLQGDQLINNIEQGGGGLTGQLTPNALKCQCEQFNALASVIASLPPAKLNTVDPAASGITSLSDGTNTFPFFNAGLMGTTLAPEETNVIQQMVWPRTAFYCWVPPGSGTDTIAAYLQSLLPSITINTSNGFGLTNGSPNQTVLKWISIADARTIYASFGLPFTLEAMGHPVSWVDDSNKNPGDPYFVGSPMGGHFIPDSGGSYLQAFGGLLSNGTAGGNGIFNGAVPESLIGGTGGIMQPPQPGSGNRNPALPATSLCVLREGLPDLCVAVIPQNYAYTDPTGVPLAAIQALGYDIVPVIADNTVESANGEVNIVSGAGGAGQYEHLITTGLANGVVQATPIDGWVPPQGPGL